MEQKKDSNDVEHKRKMVATTIASPFATIIAKYLTHPIDTIKSKVQARSTEMHKLSEYKVGHSIQLIKQTWKKQGIKGFFRGVTLSAFGSIIAFSAYMGAYERTKAHLDQFAFFKEYNAINHLISGFSAEFCSCVFWLPIDIIKERLQVQSEVKIFSYSGPREALKKIRSSEGIIGLYRAFGATLVFFGPTSAIFFACYERFKKIFVKDPLLPSLGESIICSSGAGAISGFLTTPLEMVKLRMQIQRADGAQRGIKLEDTLYGYRNIFHGLMVAYKKEGFFALYKGAGLRVLFTIPSFGFSISLTEYFRVFILANGIAEPFL